MKPVGEMTSDEMLSLSPADRALAVWAVLASCDTRRMAETGNTDSVRSTGGAVPNDSEADAQTPPPQPRG